MTYDFNSEIVFYYNLLNIWTSCTYIEVGAVLVMVGLTAFFGVLFNQGRLLVNLLFFELFFVVLMSWALLLGIAGANLDALVLVFLGLIVSGVEAGIALTVVAYYFFVERRVGAEVVRLKG